MSNRASLRQPAGKAGTQKVLAFYNAKEKRVKVHSSVPLWQARIFKLLAVASGNSHSRLVYSEDKMFRVIFGAPIEIGLYTYKVLYAEKCVMSISTEGRVMQVEVRKYDF